MSMNERIERTEVLVVGAGPVGLSLALELGLQGRRCTVVEKNERVGLAPRAKTTNVRTRELMRRWGIADRLAAASPFGVDYPSDVVFATRMNGGELARFHNAFYCAPVRDERFSEHAQWIPQYKVEEVLRSRVAEFDTVTLRFDTELAALEQDADGVTATLRDPQGTRRVRCDYLVGADGSRSSVRSCLGIRMAGESPLSHSRTLIFRAPTLAAQHTLGPAVMYWLVNRDIPCVVAPLDQGDLWTIGWPREAFPGVDPATLIRRALGFDTELELLSESDWTAHQLIADRYRDGRVFLAGDACHLHPPFGGHGMNMGVGDALDLGWKLAAVLQGWGGPALLDSYEAERRAVHRMVVDESVTNHASRSGDLAAQGIEDAGPEGDAVRLAVGRAILEKKRREFDSLGVVLGGTYRRSPVIVQEDGPEDVPGPDYRPSARPGGRAPHVWLADGTRPGASLFDHLAPKGMTLLVTHPRARADAERVLRAARERDIPLHLLEPGLPRVRELFMRDLVLIRPDHYVAWRGDDVEAAVSALLVSVGRGVTSDSMTTTETTQ